MKATAKIFILFLAINSVILLVPQKTVAQVSINFQIFYDDLSPYGYWIDTPEYGYAWVPEVSSTFIPYRTNGYWVFTNVGWTWVSNYSWGWAPFHYGRWYYDSYYDWIWIPGYEWGPGWVVWRRSEGFYGWAPIEPGISISIAYGGGYRLPYNYWTCVRDRDFGRTNIYNYYVPISKNLTIINNSTVISNVQRDNSTRVRYNAGPERGEVQRRTGTSISPITLRERSKPGHNLSNKELQIYRPRVEKRKGAEREPAPSKVTRFKDVKPTGKRDVKNQPERENQIERQQRNNQLEKQQQPQQRRNDQLEGQQQLQKQQQRDNKLEREQQSQQRRNDQLERQQPQRPMNEQSARQQQMQQQHGKDLQSRERQTKQKRDN